MASRPWATRSHSCSGDCTPPGYRQLIATIATGSWSLASASRRRWRVWSNSASTRLRYSRTFSSSGTMTSLPDSGVPELGIDEVEDFAECGRLQSPLARIGGIVRGFRGARRPPGQDGPQPGGDAFPGVLVGVDYGESGLQPVELDEDAGGWRGRVPDQFHAQVVGQCQRGG